MIERIVTVTGGDTKIFAENLGRAIEQMQCDGLTVEIQYGIGGGEYKLTCVYTALLIGRRANG